VIQQSLSAALITRWVVTVTTHRVINAARHDRCITAQYLQ
jgi:hypothetical protein